MNDNTPSLNLPILSADDWEPNKEGLFRLHERIYRMAPGVSQSTLKEMAWSPLHCKHAMENEFKPTKAMMMGTSLHTILLEPQKFGIGKSHWIRPNEYESESMVCPKCGSASTAKKCKACSVEREKQMLTKPWNEGSNTCKQWLEDHKNLPVFSADEMDRVGGMVLALREHPIASRLLSYGESELGAFYRDPETDVLVKCRVDRLIPTPVEGRFGVIDAKKCQDAKLWGKKDAFSLGCPIQVASNLFVLRGLGIDVQFFNFVAVEEQAPHGIKVWDSRPIHGSGHDQFMRYLRRYAECVENDKWPGYSEKIEELEPPKYYEVKNPD